MTTLVKSSALEAEFEAHLEQAGKARGTIQGYVSYVRRFLKFIGEERLDRVGEDRVRAFFKEMNLSPKRRSLYACVIVQFLKFAAASLPAPVTDRGSEMAPVPAVPNKKELALRQRWTVDRLLDQKDNAEDLIARLGRRLIDHYLYFESRLKGRPDSIEELTRLADDCRELIQTNLALLLSLSAQGRNVHSIIDERVQK